MLPEQQQRILGYFLEEARDHLNTIEQGLLNLQDTLNDPEMVNEVFRAAHSIKGGAAMLGLTSIQHTSHRLEDCFKVLKENPIRVDQKLESLFLSVADTLKALLEQLNTPFGLSEDTAKTLMGATEPVIKELNEHLEILVQQGGSGVITQPAPPKTAYVGATATIAPVTISQDQWIEDFKNQVVNTLREMLQTFKQPATPTSREALEQSCQKLNALGSTLNLTSWCGLCQAAQGAVSNPDNAYLDLAKVVITEIKKAQELVLQGRHAEITICQQLAALVPPPPALEEILEIEPEEITAPEVALEDIWETATTQAEDSLTDLFAVSETETPDYQPKQATPTNINSFLSQGETPFGVEALDTHGPEVGIAELNTLADLFDGEAPELDEPWQNHESNRSEEVSGVRDSETEDVENDLADFLSFDHQIESDRSTTDQSFSEDLNHLFDDNFLEKEPSHQATPQPRLEDDEFADLFILSAEDTETASIPEATHPEVDLLNEDDEFADLLILSVEDTETASIPEATQTEIAANSEQNNSSFADLLNQTTLEISEETTSEPEKSEPHLEQLFDEPKADSIPSNDLINDIFDTSQTTKTFTVEDEINNFWSQPETTSKTPNEAVNEHDIAKELEASLFSAAGEIVEDNQQLDVSENLEIEDFDLTFFQPDQPLDVLLSDNAEVNIFADLDESHSPSSDLDLFDNLDEHSKDNITIPSTYIQPEIRNLDADDLFADENNLDVGLSEQARPEIINQSASDDLDNALTNEQPILVENLSFYQTIIEEDFNFTLDELTENTRTEPIEQDLVSPFGELNLEEATQTTIQENLFFGSEDLLETTPESTTEIEDTDLASSFGELNLEVDETTADLSANVLTEEETHAAPATAEIEQVEIENEASSLDEFADLEALLDEEPQPTPSKAVMPEEDFAALEALLAPDTPDTAKPAVQNPVVSQSAIAQTLSSPAPTTSSLDDEFEHLEKILAEADQSISATPAMSVMPNQTKTARTNTRRVLREETMKVPVKQLDEMSNLVGELVVNRNTLEQDHERLRQSLDNLLIQVQHLSDVGARMQELYERSLLEASLLASRRSRGQGDNQKTNNRNLNEFELDIFTPFHTLSQEMIEFIVRVRESASDIDFVTEETERVARQFRQVTSQLQEGLTRARMVPFSQVVDRLRRGVRDNAIKCGKQVDLKTEGTENLIDKMILDHLTDPLTHMLNNAIAHGIETPDVRVAAGKPPVGIITIRAYQQGNQTIISVSDDGAGIDHEKVKVKAMQKGIITPEQAKTMTRLDVYDLLFLPSFSTAEKVDDLKGRGVGMDVVRTDISEIRGTVSTDSAIGMGTTFTIRLPVTLSICKALSCISDKARIAFPMDGVEDTLDIPLRNIHQDAQGQQYINWRDTNLPFKPLKEILAFNRQFSRGSVYGGNRDDDMVSVVVVRSGNTLIGLQVDQVLSEQEIVIKQFESPAPKPNGVAGATILGDGRIMPIADVLEIIDIFQGKRSKQGGSTSWQQKIIPPVPVIQDAKIDPTVLIVDDSITVRELLSLTFNKAGYRVEQARDGQEAWDKLRSGLPCDIVFCDIEMPRCDGLELLSRIQKDSNLNHLPIAMLTSRGADKHRQMAIQLGASGYFTKPYLEEALLEAASRMLKGEKLVTA
ncbi:MAG TPA: response regulator [Nostocaceae cyanobacterium]|nr:response regulator [Nostocaceae cyanobacterium]